MNKRLVSIIIAVVMALLAVVMINTYLRRKEEQWKVEHQETYVVVATQDIPEGATIQSNMVTATKFPQKYMQPRALQNPNAAYGKIAIGQIMRGEQLLETKLTVVRKTQDSLAVRLPKGKRAFTVRFDDYPVTAVGGQVKVGDYVDIVIMVPYTKALSGGNTQTTNVSVTLLQNILVMGVNAGGAGTQIYTFALTPKEVAIINYVKSQGAALKLSLRHPLDTNIEAVPYIDPQSLWDYVMEQLGLTLMQPQKEEAQTVKPSPSAPTLEIYRGTKKSEMEIR